ncbi:MAG TPA: hypothetical protein VL026_07120 [Rhizomicrobium sp.]|nr:hypothetical protein [Rhizomicrobium sp.]
MHSLTRPDGRSRAELFFAAAQTMAAQGVHTLLLRDDPENLDRLVEVDILVRADQLGRAVSSLVAAGWEVIDSGLFHPCKCALVLYHGGDLLKLDLHQAVIDGPLVYLANDDMFDGATAHENGFLIPRPESWMAHALLHSILGKTVIPPKLRAGMTARLNAPLDGTVMGAIAGRYGLGALFQTALSDIAQAGAFDDAATIARLRRAAQAKLRSVPRNALRQLRYSTVWTFGQVLGWRPGVLIAFIGPDGAGKSSTIAAVEKRLAHLQIPTRNAYLGPWDRAHLVTTRWVRAAGAGPCDDVLSFPPTLSAMTRARKRIFAHIKRAAFYGNLVLENLTRYLRLVWPHLTLRRVVLADRYPYDLEVGYFNAPIKTWPHVPGMVASLAPKPHFLVLLDNDAHTIWARKKEYPLETIEDVLARYHALARRRGALVVRTVNTPDAVADDFLSMHWRRIVQLRRDRIRFWH